MDSSLLVPSITKVYLREMDKRPMMTAAENKRLAVIMKSDVESDQAKAAARAEMINGNAALAIRLVRKYASFANLEWDDALQYAMEGLIHHVDRYDVELGFTFSTYLSTGLTRWVGRMIRQSENMIRVPVHFSITTFKVQRAQSTVVSRGESPTIEAIGRQMLVDGVSEEYITEKIIRRALLVYQQGAQLSLNREIDSGENDSNMSLIDTIAGTVDPHAKEDIENRQLVEHLLSHLLPAQRKQLVLFYGLDGTRPVGMHDLALARGTSRQNEDAKVKNAIKKICKKAGIEYHQSSASKNASIRMKKSVEDGFDRFGKSRSMNNKGIY